MFSVQYSIYLLIILAGFIAGLFSIKRNTPIRPVTVLLGITFISEVLAKFAGKYYRNSMPVYHVFNFIQFALLALFFYKTLQDAKIKKWIPWTIAAMFVFSIFNTLFLQDIKTFPENFLKAQTFLMLIFSSLLFIQELDSPVKDNIFVNPKFVMSVAILWFNFFSLLFFVFHNYLLKHNISTVVISKMHYFSNIIYYPMLLFATILSYSYYRNESKDQ